MGTVLAGHLLYNSQGSRSQSVHFNQVTSLEQPLFVVLRVTIIDRFHCTNILWMSHSFCVCVYCRVVF